jgi:hypothetical protein
MRRLVDVVISKDASDVRLFRHEDTVFARYEGKIKDFELVEETVSHTVSKTLATSRKTVPLSLLSSMFLDTFYKAVDL